MSQIGDIISGYSDAFEDWFSEQVTLRNFTAGATDEYGDPARNVDDSASGPVAAQVQVNSTPEKVVGPTGETHIIDGRVYVPEDTQVRDGTNNAPASGYGYDYGENYGLTGDSEPRPYPSVFITGTHEYVVVSVFDESNGTLRCDVTNAERI